MTLEQFGILAEIIASIAVIASLIYVARQLKQTTDAIHAQSREAVKEGSMSELFKVMDDPELMLLITDKEQLSSLEQSKLNAYFFASLRSREFSWLQYKNGVIDESQWGTELLVTKLFLDSKNYEPGGTGLVKMVFLKNMWNLLKILFSKTLLPTQGFYLSQHGLTMKITKTHN